MKPQKFTFDDAKKVDLGTKVIYKYPSLSKLIEVNYMVVNGRHPEKENEFIIDHDCHFIIYITKGKGRIYAGDEIFDVKIGDTVCVPPENKFAAEGKDFEYLTTESPGWYPEQMGVVSE